MNTLETKISEAITGFNEGRFLEINGEIEKTKEKLAALNQEISMCQGAYTLAALERLPIARKELADYEKILQSLESRHMHFQLKYEEFAPFLDEAIKTHLQETREANGYRIAEIMELQAVIDDLESKRRDIHALNDSVVENIEQAVNKLKPYIYRDGLHNYVKNKRHTWKNAVNIHGR